MTSSVLDHALNMVARGFSVFPLRPSDGPDYKQPYWDFAWTQHATHSPDKVRTWFGPGGKYERCGYGVPMGAAWGVIDADMKQGGNGLASFDLMQQIGDVEFSLIASTPSGGRHGYFKTDGLGVSNAIAGIKEFYPGVDVRSGNGFVVGPGCRRADGARYKILEDNPKAAGAAPSFLERLRLAPQAKGAQGKTPVMDMDLPASIEMGRRWLRDGAPESIQGISEGGGGKVAFRVAADLKDLAISEEMILELMLEDNGWNETKAFPPWPADELADIIRNAMRYSKNAPGSKNALAEFDEVDLSPTMLALNFMDPSTLEGDPPPREWIVDGAIPKRQVTLLYGDGGLGKSLLAQQLASSMATGKPWLNMNTRRGKVLAVFCEDDKDELWRRQKDIDRSNEMDLPHGSFKWLAADEVAEHGSILLNFANGTWSPTKFYRDLEASIESYRPDLVIIDPLANVYSGSELDRAQVTQFVSRAFKSLCIKYDTTVLALAHPSMSGMESGRGTSGSSAWSNAVRSRLYLTRPKNDPTGDYRELHSKKSNYGKSEIALATVRWRAGVFALATGEDDSPDRVAEYALLAAIKVLIAGGTALSSIDTARNYAVRQAMRLDETAGLSQEVLGRALVRLLRDGTLGTKTVKDGARRERSVLTIEIDDDKFEQPGDDDLA